MAIRSYRDLDVWRLGMDAVEKMYGLTAGFPDREKYGLSSQLQRAMVSIPANLAEGHGKDSTKQFLFHISVALGSLAEAETYLLLCERLHYGDRTLISELLGDCNRLGRMLHNLQKKLKSKIDAT